MQDLLPPNLTNREQKETNTVRGAGLFTQYHMCIIEKISILHF